MCRSAPIAARAGDRRRVVEVAARPARPAECPPTPARAAAAPRPAVRRGTPAGRVARAASPATTPAAERVEARAPAQVAEQVETLVGLAARASVEAADWPELEARARPARNRASPRLSASTVRRSWSCIRTIPAPRFSFGWIAAEQ